MNHTRDTAKIDPFAKVFDYHERSKHHFDHFANALGYIDWAAQPNPFRQYQDAPKSPLPLPVRDITPDYATFFMGVKVKCQPLNLDTLSAFFYFSLALSAWKNAQNSRWSLRVNPSSGNSHPTESYLITDGITGLSKQPGIYHYLPLLHQLECRARLQPSVWHAFTDGLLHDGQLPKGSFLMALSSIHRRESWKYGERAFRYCQHDCGHALAALRIAAGLMGWQLTLVEGISDADLGQTIGINRDEDFPNQQEREAPDLLVVVTPESTTLNTNWTPDKNALTDIAATQWLGKANLLSRNHHSWPWIDNVALACEKPETKRQQCHRSPNVTPPPSQTCPIAAISAGKIIRQRRSAVELDGETSICKTAFYQILTRTLPVQNLALFDVVTWPARVHLGLFVHRVDELPAGLYILVRDIADTEQLRQLMDADFHWSRPVDCPENLPLYCLWPSDTQKTAMHLSCHQNIAGDGVFSCAMLAKYEQSIRQFGPWWYRRLFWETGMIGQMLYLEAEANRIRATGIGCFFDDPVHRVFGLKDRHYQSLYHFTMGGPVEDNRLEILPAYQFLEGMEFPSQ